MLFVVQVHFAPLPVDVPKGRLPEKPPGPAEYQTKVKASLIALFVTTFSTLAGELCRTLRAQELSDPLVLLPSRLMALVAAPVDWTVRAVDAARTAAIERTRTALLRICAPPTNRLHVGGKPSNLFRHLTIYCGRTIWPQEKRPHGRPVEGTAKKRPPNRGLFFDGQRTR